MSQRLRISTGRFILLLLVVSVKLLSAQPVPYSAAQRQQINLLRQTIQKTYDANYSRAVSLAKQVGHPLRVVRSNGRIVEVAGVDEHGNLLFNATTATIVGNTQVANATRTSSLYSGGSLGLNLSGSSASVQNKLGIWDGGAVLATHVEVKGRVTQNDKASTTAADEEHPTHVATTMIGAGINPLARGMSFGAKLQAWDYTSDVSEMTTAAPNLLVSNHSYGILAGYQYNPDLTGSTQWEWYGDTTISRMYDYKFGLYDSRTQSWDQVANAAPYYLIVKSAGNDHGADGFPGAGQSYILVNHNKKVSTVVRDTQNGYDQISTNGVAKNILSVGAVNYPLYGYNQPSDVVLADFSSWGPTDDGRIKPDIVGIGVNVLSANSSSDSAYVSLSGTSMASPNVAGSVLLLQEYYTQLHSGSYMRSSTLRGLVLHTADEAGTTLGPDYRFGWGLLNMERAARVIGNTDQNHLLSERTLTQGQRDTIQVTASGRGQLVATICWTDPAGTTSNTLNDRTPKLVNDLDLRISDGTTTTQPWILDPNNPANAATHGDNIRDNIEQVLFTNTIPGKTYTLIIGHKGNISGSKQDYALLVSGIGGKTYCESKPTSTADTKISRVQLGSIDQTGSTGCTDYTDFTQVATTIQAGQQIPLTVSLGTCGATKNVVVKAFADWNQNGSFDEAGETLATSAVLANSAQFSTTLTIPTNVQNGQLIRFRLVATETDNSASVAACGLYGNGETQDYLLNVVQTLNDVGATALISPEATFCGQTNTDITVSVKVHNYGSADQVNVPVSVKLIDAANTELASLSGIVSKLPAFRESQVTLQLPASISLAAGQTYRFILATNLGTDQNPANNSVTETRTTAPTPANGLFAATQCSSDSVISLHNAGSGTAFWYDAPTGGNLLAAGNQTTAPKLPTSGQFYATLNDFSGTIGPASKSAFGGGTYSGNFGPSPLISTTVPLTIESARLYIGNAGQLTFTVRKLDETAISSVTLDVTPTRDQSLTATTNSQLVDDPNDQGAVYPLNLRIPAAGDYKITIEYTGGASIFRSNVSVAGFPYQLKTQTGAPIVTIKGSLFNTGTTNDTLKTAWYYFYNIKVRSLDCPSLQRTAVVPSTGTSPTATITPSGSVSICQGSSITLQASTTDTGVSYQWYRNGAAIAGAIISTFQATTAGAYSLQVANNCPSVRSPAVTVSVNSAQSPIVTANGFTLSTNAVSNIQWLVDGVPITEATGTTYTVVKSGRYSVKGNVNGCGEAISNEVVLTILATEPVAGDDELLVYPNPATRQVTISLGVSSLLSQSPTLRLTDIQGRTVHTGTLQLDGKNYSTVVDVASLPGGTFFVIVEDERTQSVRVKRIHKQ
ncbi:S8 family serine peptidase [Spirosoma sp. KCTC 42546]|uniref:S8 family serine peptidase n=1 Tax=Spirosoma sp. KCTC 42546 TaxID=2520506 RepID=UPI001157E59C|nr:S8 family serine peptidase [Spirosoma sp. KCTC 42546]QDK82874.1 S8 family serine peptidase [Spirosoma sp. KCTC 42546]